MQQVVYALKDDFFTFDLPDPSCELMPGVRWGRHEEPLTPAFWVAMTRMEGEVAPGGFKLGKSLAEEVSVCLLGGHGAPAEVGLAAYERVRNALTESGGSVLDEQEIFALLSEPLLVRGRSVRYRFARQRAKYLAGSLRGLQHINESDLDDISLRAALCEFPGIGPKTASWIVRNRRGSDGVAILDVHIVRACVIMGVFAESANPARGYFDLERRFLSFCQGGDVRASVMDAVMWGTMRTLSPSLIAG